MRSRPAHKTKKPRKRRLWFIVSLPLLAVSFAVFIVLSSAYWDGEFNFTVLVGNKSGAVALYTFHEQSHSIVKVLIPGDTEVDVARNYGKLKIKNLWQLATNENIDGQLIQQTVTKSFMFPVEAWIADDEVSFFEGDFFDRLVALVSPVASNLTLGDKLRIFLYSLKITNENYSEIDLKDYPNYLVIARLLDGESGYVVNPEAMPARLIGLYSDPRILTSNVTSLVVYSPGTKGKGRHLSTIIETLGTKVALLESGDEVNVDCEVRSINSYVRKKMARVFNCKESKNLPRGNFGLEIAVGEKSFL